MPTFDSGQALLIGVANYENIDGLPEQVLNDVNSVSRVLTDPQLCGYPPQNVQTLLDYQATKVAVLEGLNNLAKRCQPDSTVVIYISSHGGRLEGTNAGEYLLPVDVLNSSEEELARTAISNAEFSTYIEHINAERILVIFDCCYAAGIVTLKSGQSSALKNLSENYYDALSQGRGCVIYAASRNDETSQIAAGASHSLFTQHLLNGLQGAVPPQSGTIRVSDLFYYVAGKVQETHDKRHPQHPVLKGIVENNFPIALHQGNASEAEQKAITTLLIRTKEGDSNQNAAVVGRISNRPSVDARVDFEREQQLPSGFSRQSRAALSGFPIPVSAIESFQKEDWAVYFEQSYPKYLNQRDRYLDDVNRLHQIKPVLLSMESTPLTNVILELTLSEGIERIRVDDKPKRPSRPETPKVHSRYNISSLASSAVLADFHHRFERPNFAKRESEPFKINGPVIEWRIPRLQHKRPLPLDSLWILLPLVDQVEVFNIELPYSIYADQFEDPQVGALNIAISFQDLQWQDAEELDAQKQEEERRREEAEEEERWANR